MKFLKKHWLTLLIILAIFFVMKKNGNAINASGETYVAWLLQNRAATPESALAECHANNCQNLMVR